MGDPGYRIRDEFDDSLRHTGYRVSMGNSGYPNSAGSQIFITGSVTVPQYDDLHTIFGTIVEDDSMTPGNSKDPSDPSSRDVVDAIISAGASKTTITAVSFTREGPEAMSYDENQLELPVVSASAQRSLFKLELPSGPCRKTC
jgi:cyclophilin family peptidyl-prolyl cis-trans isomerase